MEQIKKIEIKRKQMKKRVKKMNSKETMKLKKCHAK